MLVCKLFDIGDKRITRFYEKVLKVKADVAAIHLKFCFDPVAAI
jgi:hypothetical protein